MVAAWLAASAGQAGAARADDGRERALAHFKQGQVHYNLGEFGQALGEFREAYRLKDDPTLLFNIGQCLWKVGDDAAALHAYRAYLRGAPDAPNRREVELRILELERRGGGRPGLAEPRPAASTVPARGDPPRDSAQVAPVPAPDAPRSSPAGTGREQPLPPARLAAGSGGSPEAGADGASRRLPWWVWVAAGALLVSGAAGAYAATRDPTSVPGTPLGAQGAFR